MNESTQPSKVPLYACAGIALLAVAAAIIMFRLNLSLQQEIDELKAAQQPVRVEQASQGVQIERAKLQVKRKPASRSYKIICPTCKGEKKLIYEEKRKETIYYACQLCTAKGELVRKVPGNGELCMKCKGMGKVPKEHVDIDKKTKIFANLCVSCQGVGWTKTKPKKK